MKKTRRLREIEKFENEKMRKELRQVLSDFEFTIDDFLKFNQTMVLNCESKSSLKMTSVTHNVPFQ